MKRLALLIGSPSTQQNGDFLAGVQTDIENIERFLKSSIGGSWQDTEIKKFQLNPNYSQVEPFLKECESKDFAFVYFSGHGATDKSNLHPRVKFRENDYPYVKDLANRANKQITIIDACRGYSEFSNFDGGLGRIDFLNYKPEFARAVFNNYVDNLQNSRVLFFASQEGQNSLNVGSEGGLFSINLLSAAKNLVNNNNDLVVNVSKVFNLTYNLTSKYHQPELHKTDENALKLPFAIKPDYIPQQTNTVKQAENNSTIVEDIVKVTLVSAGVIAVGFLIGSLLTGNRK